MAYVDPRQVVSPKGVVKNLRVMFDSGRTRGSWSIATLSWNDMPRVGLRWNGEEGDEGKGNPQSRGNPTWFIVPEPLAEEVLRAAERLRQQDENKLSEGYRAMAADREREAEAEEWSEALIGDISEAR
jgi:hypothetical protein